MLLDNTLRTLLAEAHTIAIIGAKDKPGPVDMVGRYLKAAGYTVIPVHPVRKDVWGLVTYRTLADIPVPVDVVNVFRAAEHCPAHAHEALALSPRPRLFWMQQGICSAEAGQLLAAGGIRVVEDACIMVDHRRLFGGI